MHGSARRHGIADADIVHALDHALVGVEFEPDADPSKTFVVGPDRDANLLEIIVIELENDRRLVVHAMKLRRSMWALLPEVGDDE